MDLHHGRLLWQAAGNREIPLTPGVIADHYDVVIVGGGVSGALCAHALAGEGLRVAVIDKGAVGSGSTLASIGQLQYSSDIMLHELIAQIGQDRAVSFYKSCRNAIDELGHIADSLDFSCDFTRRNSLYYASEQAHTDRLKKEFEALNTHGFQAEWWTEGRLKAHYPFFRPAALMTHHDAEVNPLRLTLGILNKLSRKVDVFEHVKMTGLRDIPDGLEVQTSAGEFRTSHVILATGYATVPYLNEPRLLRTRSYAIATEPVADLSAWKDRVLIWETRRPYLYMRTTPEGRILAGGQDEDKPDTPDSPALIANRARHLLKEVQKLFPQLETRIAFAWGAVFGQSTDHLPFIGRHPTIERLYYLLGYGGNGTVYSMVGAQVLRDLIVQRPNPLAEIVRLDR
ncbi:NAD(P)/FAD-dependent oxidoreductase [Paenibacillus tuaregi]|uniref:NAD(P)/FAD-dependent oxidoreductase n=1 Tax=Paenibacillus tuaregi TaxID=1816681 RepID=UPI000838060B|nr:FAD-dependent oxidoreductase [Paenibacillus tuaregi]